MNFFSQLQSVPISAIKIEDTSYCLTISAEAPGDELLESIKHFGILNPPILRRRKNNSYCIVAGRKRVSAAGILDPGNPVLCRILREDLEETAVFSLLLEEALTGRELSIVEQIIFFEKLITTVSMDAAIPLLGKLGHKPQKHILNDLLQLRTLSIPALQALHHGVIQLRNARKLLDLSPGDQELLIQLITNLHFGGSKQQKLIDLSRELILRKNVPLKDILTHFPAVHEAGQSVNIPQYGAALLSWLHEQCFPRISQAENDFQQKVARLGLPSSMRIDHTPAFENEEIILSLRFPGWRSLNRILGRINTLMQDE